jgi:TetR/AcrR family transcriptional regulator, regulator of autoinduction and epiphytic fitness
MDEPTRVDGRTARGQRTRAAVVDALLALQEEGDLEPTAQRVAARAGVALRTVFGHFSDMETLWAQAGERELAKIAALADVPSGDLPLDERVERFCASRARVLEAVLPVLRAARLREHASAALRRNREIFAEAGDAEVDLVFATELEPLDEAERAVVRSAFHVVAGGTAWELLRCQRGLDVEQASEVLLRSVRRLVPTSGPL